MLMVILVPANRVSASPDIAGPDLVIDAPWRTTRDYLPVLFFTPEFEKSPYRKINAFRLSNYDPFSTQQQTIFVDSRDTKDDLFDCAISFIGPDGEARAHLTETEEVDSFWHYIARVPVSCIGFGDKRGKPGEHFLRGEIDWATVLPTDLNRSFIDQKAFHILRVIVTPDGFAKFSPVDHQFDVHVHTVAEQTSWHGAFNPDASKKAYGGPLAMLMESAYALGMVDVQLRNGNWSEYRNKIVTTDHNAFFSGDEYESGAEPGYGPTSRTNGEEEEFLWYRNNLGALGGEEITVQGANGKPLRRIDLNASWNISYDDWGALRLSKLHVDVDVDVDTENVLGLGSHFLSYGAPHFDGPWHGGGVLLTPDPIGVHNDISIVHAISHMGSSNGFGYASHPESPNFGWSEDYYERAIGLVAHNDSRADSPILQNNRRDFVFKGLQIWNGHGDMTSRKSGNLGFEESHSFDPHTQSSRDQQFVPNPKWRDGHDKTYETYKRLLRRSLRYSFSDNREHIFIRKLYLSAGTDSHAAFNDDVSMVAAHIAEIAKKSGIDLSSALPIGLSADNNAFGRLRTYTLTSQRYIRAGASIPADCTQYPFCGGVHPAPSNFPLEDYKEGNTVATDGPVGRFSTDANCRFNSDIHKLIWHDDLCIWENHDGMIGGRGMFDGGNTMLAPVGNEGVMMRYDWIGKNDYRPDSESGNGTMAFNLVRINSNSTKYSHEENGEFTPGRSGRSNSAHINEILKNPTNIEFPDKTALILEGELSKTPNEVLADPANVWFPRDTLISEGEVIDPHLTKFVTNPIWIAPYKITVNPVRTCPIEPGQLKVAVEFGISMDTTLPQAKPADTVTQALMAQLILQNQNQKSYKMEQQTRARDLGKPIMDAKGLKADADERIYEGIRIVVKPLNHRGDSGDSEYEISGQNGQWQAVEIPGEFMPDRIQDAKYTTTNTMIIPCGDGWNSANSNQKHDMRFASYAIVVDQIYDMYMNYLNPIARTVSVARPKSLSDTLINVGTLGDEVIGLKEKYCSARNKKLCGDWGASCEVSQPVSGADKDMCRWGTAKNAAQCQRTVGIWTTAQSKYARNHPYAVAAGASGACITEVQNIKDRIQ
jgi:hypothetical protein